MPTLKVKSKLLYITLVVEAKELAAKDINGLSDPFAVINVGDQSAQTQVRFKTLNPVWNQEFEFKITPELINNKLSVNLFDKDMVGKDFLGVVSVAISDILRDGPEYSLIENCPKEYEIQGKDVSGSLYLVAGFTDLVEVKHQESIEDLYFQQYVGGADNPLESPVSSNEVVGLLKLEIQSAQNLPHIPNLIKSSFDSDPFCIISIGPKVFKTKKIRHTLNPVWNERLFVQLNENELANSISLHVYDHERITRNDSMAQLIIKLKDVLDACPKAVRVNDVPCNMESVSFSLPLNLTVPENKLKEPTQPIINFSASFISYRDIRRNFWLSLAKVFDSNNSGKLNRIELVTMLDSIGSTFSQDTIDKLFHQQIEWTYEQVFEDIEELIFLNDHETEHLVQMTRCPICNKKMRMKHDLNVVSHIALCSFQDFGKMDQFVMNGFLTESYTTRKWYTKIISFVTNGSYGIGKNNANILVKNRETGQLFEEKIPAYIRLGIRLLYQKTSSNTVDSKRIKKLVRSMTFKQGKKFDDPSSVKYIPQFIKYHQLDLSEVAGDLGSFKTFNEFFFRKLKPGARQLASAEQTIAVSPADCRMLVFQEITKATELWIKGKSFTIENLLQSQSLSQKFNGGSLVICRLAPQDYHRFHFPVDGTLSEPTNIDGEYYTVNPMAIRTAIDVYTENKRSFSFIESPQFGSVCFVSVGAMMVGSIKITSEAGAFYNRLDEHGYFQFGGSTCLLLFEKNRIIFDRDLVENSSQCLETLVKVGQSIGAALVK